MKIVRDGLKEKRNNNFEFLILIQILIIELFKHSKLIQNSKLEIHN